MTIRSSLWISLIAALMPPATLTFALLASDTEWTGGAAAIVLIIALLMTGAIVLPVAAWGFCSAVILRRMRFSDGTTRLLFVASFAALILLVAALPPGPDGGGKFGSAIGQGLVIGITALGSLLRQAPILGFAWVALIAIAAYARLWIGLVIGILGAGALGLSLPDQPEFGREAPRPASRYEADNYHSRDGRKADTPSFR